MSHIINMNIIFLSCLFIILLVKNTCAENSDVFSLIKTMLSSNNPPKRVRTVEDFSKDINNTAFDFIGLVEQYEGYKAEEHYTQTTDGYNLVLHRIVSGPSSPKRDGKPVVYLQHGLVASSDVWVFFGPEHSLAMYLANKGYDVWLGNLRGNAYSKSHIVHDTGSFSRSYWSFGMDELGNYDLKSCIDYVLNATKKNNLTYVGYSMGTTTLFILLSETPSYNEKINLAFHIGPSAYFKDKSNAVSMSLLKMALSFTLGYELLPMTVDRKMYAKTYCSNVTEDDYCKKSLQSFLDLKNMNLTLIPTLMTYLPSGASYQTVNHFLQIYETGNLQKYDFGCPWYVYECDNKKAYNQSEPPKYDLTKITTPTVLIHSDADSLVRPDDVKYLKTQLTNATVESIEMKNFNHMDYVWSLRDIEVYQKIFEKMQQKGI